MKGHRSLCLALTGHQLTLFLICRHNPFPDSSFTRKKPKERFVCCLGKLISDLLCSLIVGSIRKHMFQL